MTTSTLTQIESDLQTLQQEATDAIATATDLDALEKLRVNYLGKKGQLSQILRGMGKLSAEERPKIGAIANQVKEVLQGALDTKLETLQKAKIEAQLKAETLDVTMPGVGRPLGKMHPLQSTIDRVLDIFVGLGYTVAEGPQIETDYYNFEALNTLLTTQRGICRIHFICRAIAYCAPILPQCRFATWSKTNPL